MNGAALASFEDRFSTAVIDVLKAVTEQRHASPPFPTLMEGRADLDTRMVDFRVQIHPFAAPTVNINAPRTLQFQRARDAAVRLAASALLVLIDCFGEPVQWPNGPATAAGDVGEPTPVERL